MGKVAIVTDSNSGITQQEAKELGVHVLPMPFIVDGETHFENVDLTRGEFFQLLKAGINITTSQPSAVSVSELWEDLLKEHDEVLHIPMSSGLSGSYETAYLLSGKFDGKVKVVDNHRISVTQRQSVLDALAMVEAGKTADAIHAVLEETKADTSIYIMVDTLTYLRKGGRITPAVAAMGTLFRIKPILQIQGERLDSFAKARTMEQAKSIMLGALRKDVETRFSAEGEGKNLWLQIAHTENGEAAEAFKEEVLEQFEGYTAEDVYIDHLSLSVACHIGPGALAIACTKRLQG